MIEHIAQLAKLKLSEKEKEKFSKELLQILDFVKKLNEVDTSNIEPFFSDLKNILRKDEIKIKDHKSKVKILIKQAPEKEGNYFKTISIL